MPGRCVVAEQSAEFDRIAECASSDHDPVWLAGREAGFRDALIALAERRGEFFDELDRNIADSLRREREYVVAHDAAVQRSHREKWASYIENWDASVGPEPPTARAIVAALRLPSPPFGVAWGGDR